MNPDSLLMKDGLDNLESGNLAQAESIFTNVAKTTNNPDADHMLAVIKLLQQSPDAALEYINKALSKLPNNGAYNNTLGGVYLEQLNLVAAAQSYAQAVSLAPQEIDYRFNLAYVLFELKKYRQAAEQFRIILKSNLEHVHSLKHLTMIQLYDLKLESAFYYANLWVHQGKQGHVALYYRAVVKEKLNLYLTAITDYLAALTINPQCIDTLAALGSCYCITAKFEQAEQYLTTALAIDSKHPTVINTLGIVYLQTGKFELAKKLFLQARAVNYNSAVPYCSLALLAMYQCDFADAINHLNLALSVDSACNEAKVLMAIILLKQKNFVKGWKYYRARKESATYTTNSPLAQIYQYVPWSGVDEDCHLLVWAEQGIGDQIFYLGVIKHLLDVTNKLDIILECDPRLQAIFARSFPDCKIITSLEQLQDLHQIKQNIKQVAYGDLFGYFIKKEQDYTKYAYNLVVNNNSSSCIRNKYQALFANKLLVGISWRTNNSFDGHLRSIQLESLLPILQNTRMQFINLQYGDTASECQLMLNKYNIRIYTDPEIDVFYDLEQYFAQIKALDLVICIDNSSAHFAGALGVKTKILLPYACDWRWFGYVKSPWHNQVELYKQILPGDWQEPIARLAQSDLFTTAAFNH